MEMPAQYTQNTQYTHTQTSGDGQTNSKLTHAQAHTCTHAHRHACTHIHTHTHTQTNTHIHTHTHTHTQTYVDMVQSSNMVPCPGLALVQSQYGQMLGAPQDARGGGEGILRPKNIY